MGTMKMRELVGRYMAHRRASLGDLSYANIKGTLDRLAAEWDRTRRAVSGLDEDWMSEFLTQFRAGGVGGNGMPLGADSMNKVVSQFRAFLEYLVRRGLVSPFVLDACRRVPRQLPRERVRLSAGQVVRMIETAEDPWERWVLAFASQTLARESELRNRQLRHLHLDRGVVDWCRRKTSDVDEMPITAPLAAEWRRWVEVYAQRCGTPQPDWMLVPQRWNVGPPGHQVWRYVPTEAPYRPASVVKRHVARVTGLSADALKGQGVHILRRSMARALYERLCIEQHPDPARPVQTALGHASRGMTMHYIGVRPDREERNALLTGTNLLWVEQDNVIELKRAE